MIFALLDNRGLCHLGFDLITLAQSLLPCKGPRDQGMGIMRIHYSAYLSKHMALFLLQLAALGDLV